MYFMAAFFFIASHIIAINCKHLTLPKQCLSRSSKCLILHSFCLLTNIKNKGALFLNVICLIHLLDLNLQHPVLRFQKVITMRNEDLNIYSSYFWKRLLLFFFFGCSGSSLWCWGMWDLSSLARDRTCVPGIRRWILNHWNTREILRRGYLARKDDVNELEGRVE